MTMKRTLSFAAALAITIGIGASLAHAWEYIDASQRVNVSGSQCRAQDANAEYDVYHYPGSTSVGTWATSVRLFCPVNRRNMHAYDKNMRGSGFDLTVNDVWVKVDSPSGNLKCRLFGKTRNSTVVNVSPWTKPSSAGLGTYVYIHWGTAWTTVNWGVMCDVPGGEAVLNIEADINNTNA